MSAAILITTISSGSITGYSIEVYKLCLTFSSTEGSMPKSFLFSLLELTVYVNLSTHSLQSDFSFLAMTLTSKKKKI